MTCLVHIADDTVCYNEESEVLLQRGRGLVGGRENKRQCDIKVSFAVLSLGKYYNYDDYALINVKQSDMK